MKFLIVFFLTGFSLLGVTPNLIPVQGVLSEADGSPVSGQVNLTLSLYNSEAGNDELWKEERNNFKVKNGYISLYLGKVTELNTSVISNAEELWLEIKFNDETMPRIRLVSVPFAIEAIKAQKVKQIGEITDNKISNIFNSGCADGFYLKGYDNNGNSICAEDKTKSDNNIHYNAGYGINIDENNNISVNRNLYSAGNGIKLTNNNFSVDYTKVANTSHNHDVLYYRKSDNSQRSQVLKFTGNSMTGYKLDKSEIKEYDNGEVHIDDLDVINNATALDLTSFDIVVDKITGQKDTDKLDINTKVYINGKIKADDNITVKKDMKTNGSGNITAGKILSTGDVIVSNIKFSQTNQYMKMLKVIISDKESDSDDYYIYSDGGLHTYPGNVLRSSNSICFLSFVGRKLGYSANHMGRTSCNLHLDNGDWKLSISNSGNLYIKCGVTCFKWTY